MGVSKKKTEGTVRALKKKKKSLTCHFISKGLRNFSETEREQKENYRLGDKKPFGQRGKIVVIEMADLKMGRIHLNRKGTQC